MLSQNKAKINIGIGVGIIFYLAPRALPLSNTTGNADLLLLLILLLMFVSMAFFSWGYMNYAAGKGHSKWFGLLGLLSGSFLGVLIGFIILISLPDRHKENKTMPPIKPLGGC